MEQIPAEFVAPTGAGFRCAGFDHINFKPHPYMITPKHVAYASDHGGILSEAAIEEAERNGAYCGVGRYGDRGLGRQTGQHSGCILPYREHTSEKVLVLVLPDDHPEDLNKIPGLNDYLQGIKEALIKQGCAGVIFPKESQQSRR